MTIGDSKLLDSVEMVDRGQVEDAYAEVYVVQSGVRVDRWRTCSVVMW
jgi:hypothetical protein